MLRAKILISIPFFFATLIPISFFGWLAMMIEFINPILGTIWWYRLLGFICLWACGACASTAIIVAWFRAVLE